MTEKNKRISPKLRSKAAETAELLKNRYPDPKCGLEWKNPYQLLIMAILSAQCTDERVNIVSKELFSAYPDFYSLAAAPIEDIEAAIRTVGLFRAKSLALSQCAKRVCDVYGGEIPREMDDLLTLRGVGRKVANLVRGDVFGVGGIVADTHCIRICHRLGLTKKADPLTTERELDQLIKKEEQSNFCHRIVNFGREVCTARSPKCDECEMQKICSYRNKK